MAEKSIHQLESNAITLLNKELAEPLGIASEVLNLASALLAIDTPGTISRARIVRLLLLQRIQNDLRCCVVLAERGYPLQALANAASIFEGWVTITAIKDENDATRWLSHANADESASFGRIRTLTRHALQHTLGQSHDADKMYAQYQQLCMTKHLNPILESSRWRRTILSGTIMSAGQQ